MKPMLDRAISSMQVQISGLDNSLARLQEKDRRLFNQVVARVRAHDDQRASILATELVELRKMTKMVIQAKLALEQIVIRTRTIKDLGEVVATIGPAVSAIKSVGEDIATVAPIAEENFSDITGLLSSILVDAGQEAGLTLNFRAATEDAERILDEASVVAEQMMLQKFPDIPMEVSLSQAEEATYA